MADPLSILHIDSELPWRGGQEALLRLALGLRDRGHRQTIACPGQSDLADRADASGFPVLAARSSREVRLAILSHKFDIAHSHSGRAQNLAAMAGLGLPIRRVVTRHVAFQPKHPWVHRLKYTFTCDGIIAVSGAVRDVLIASGVPAEKIEVIYTGVEIPARLPDAGERRHARQRLGVPEDAFIVGHMAAFTREKGQEVAIAAIAQCKDAAPVHLVLAGEGPMADVLRKEAQDAGAPVTFPGFVEDPRLLFAALDLFIMPSRSEAWGLAALQAMAHGVPAVASKVGGLPEMIEHRKGGWLVAPGNVEELAAAIRSAASDPAALAEASAAARNRACAFSIQRAVDRTESFYRKVLGRPSYAAGDQ